MKKTQLSRTLKRKVMGTGLKSDLHFMVNMMDTVTSWPYILVNYLSLQHFYYTGNNYKCLGVTVRM